jgi:hypothetical protein
MLQATGGQPFPAAAVDGWSRRPAPGGPGFRPSIPGRLLFVTIMKAIDMGKLTLPDGQSYTVGSVAKARAEKAAVIKALEDQADTWERKVHDGAYNLQKDIKDYLTAKAKSARAEAARLKGEAVPAPAARPAKPVTVTLPR